MRHLLTTTITFACLGASGVSAADLPSAREPAVYVAPAPAFTWQGFYAGANVGYGSGLTDKTKTSVGSGYFPSSPDTTGIITSKRPNGNVFGGGQVGYNYQIGHLVVGAENDFQYLGNDKKDRKYSFSGVGAVPSDFNYVGPSRTIQWFATGRGRLGYAFDNFLVYATAGFAYANLKEQYCLSGSCSKNKIGGVAGAGVEYALTQNWSVKVEALYADFGKSPDTTIGYDAAGRQYSSGGKKATNDLALVRAGINYRF